MRELSDPFVASPCLGKNIHSTLRVSEQDEAVLVAVGGLLGSLQRKDLRERVAAGRGPKQLQRARRKRELTVATSGRWASAITRRTADMYEREMMNLNVLRDRDAAEITTIRRRLDADTKKPTRSRERADKQKPVYEVVDGERRKVRSRKRHSTKKAKPYVDKFIKAAKNERLQKLQARHAETVQRIKEGRPSITVGGKRLANRRHNLDEEPFLAHEDWLQTWRMKRLFLTVDGDTGCIGGNQTIRVLPDDRPGAKEAHHKLVMRLPNELANLSNTPGREPTYEFSTTVAWKNKRLRPDWEQRMSKRLSVSYMIRWDEGVWRIHCAWSNEPPEPASVLSLDDLCGRRVLGVDFNADHFAAVVVDGHGNIVGAPQTFSFNLT